MLAIVKKCTMKMFDYKCIICLHKINYEPITCSYSNKLTVGVQ